ncbi:MAG: MarC family protein [Gammaproteobacteria bacterium]
MDKAALITFTTAMFAILNPLGGVAIFAGMVSDRSPAERRSIAIRCSFAVALILIVSVWAGEHVLRLFGISIPSLQAAGGIMIAVIALSMLASSQSAIHDTKTDGVPEKAAPDIAVVPLAMPMVAGPGAIVTVIVTSHQYLGVENNIKLSLVCLTMAGLVCICFLAAGAISRLMGVRGLEILTKFMGMLLLAIALGMLATGVKGLLPGLAA